ncbi:MAG: DUF1294 domain-containing protein [Ruminococcus sp.]|nr:DUF1294 domain-containing protein [Ruminococcus sp.]
MTLPVLLRCWLGITAVMSIITLLTFGIDKIRSMVGISLGPFKLSFNRVPEKTLLTLSFFGGSLGAMIGMLLFRHKSRKTRFKYSIPIHLLIWIVLGLLSIDLSPSLEAMLK